MITAYRHPTTTKITSNVANLRYRPNSTNSHTYIWRFEPVEMRHVNNKVRCTPTFHSNVFANDRNNEKDKRV